MNRVVPIVHTAAVMLERFDHEPGVAHRDPEREQTTGHAVSFVETGSFRVRTDGAWREVAAGALFVTRPGLEFSCAHDHEHPSDCCLSLAYHPEAVESLRGEGLRGASGLVHGLTNRRAYLRHRLRACGRGDEARVEALAGALQATFSGGTTPVRLFRAERLTWYATRMDRAAAMIEVHYAEPLSLSILARDAGMSVYHFARIFNELHGQPPHRYLSGVRLVRAASRLRAGATVTDTCLAVGFGSLSHFVTTFRRHFGVTPSAMRQLGRGGVPSMPRPRA